MIKQDYGSSQDFPLRLKWPNDFYFNREAKVGGLMCKLNMDGKECKFTFGTFHFYEKLQ